MGKRKARQYIALPEEALRVPQHLFPDVTLRLVHPEDNTKYLELRAHRAVLSLYSPYFNALFSSGMKETGAEVVEIHEENLTILKEVVNLIYQNKVYQGSDAHVTQLLEVANKYQMDKVVKLLEEVVEGCIVYSNVGQFSMLAERLGTLPGIQTACQKCVQEAIEAKHLGKCRKVPVTVMTQVLGEDGIAICEVDIFQEVATWLKVEGGLQDQDICKTVLGTIRFETLMDTEVRSLMDEITADEVLAASHVCSVVEELIGQSYIRRLKNTSRPTRGGIRVVREGPRTFTVVIPNDVVQSHQPVYGPVVLCYGHEWQGVVNLDPAQNPGLFKFSICRVSGNGPDPQVHIYQANIGEVSATNMCAYITRPSSKKTVQANGCVVLFVSMRPMW